MIDDGTKARLLEEFGRYLDDPATLPLTGDERGTDLFTLFGELAALRTEVKTESRLFRTTLDDLREVQGWLKDNQARLDQTVERFTGELPTLRRAPFRPVLLDLLDVHDRLSAGLRALANYRPVKGWFWTIRSEPADRRFIESVREGQAMTLRRLEELLARQNVRPMEVVGKPVDPYTMKVVELDTPKPPDKKAKGTAPPPSGTVTEELRKGFWWGEEVLRLAEVKALP